MERQSKVGIGLKGLMVLLAVGGAMSAHAQYDLGVWNLTFVSEAPGAQGGSDWSTDGGAYNGWAGGLNWTEVQGSTSLPLAAMCSSFNQEFDPYGSPFNTHAYWLGGSTPTTGGIVLGDSITPVALPGVDTPTVTGTTFLRAAALFGDFYPTAITSNIDGEALQLAVWQTIYSLAPGTPFAPTFSGSAPPQLVADETAYYNAGQALNSSNWAGLLTHVDWYNYEGTTQGQGQFAYVAAPEPGSVVLLLAGGAALLRRRQKARQA